MCLVTDDGVRCALEYNCVRWGSHDLFPQAGIAICERARKTGCWSPSACTTTLSHRWCRRLAAQQLAQSRLAGVGQLDAAAFHDISDRHRIGEGFDVLERVMG